MLSLEDAVTMPLPFRNTSESIVMFPPAPPNAATSATTYPSMPSPQAKPLLKLTLGNTIKTPSQAIAWASRRRFAARSVAMMLPSAAQRSPPAPGCRRLIPQDPIGLDRDLESGVDIIAPRVDKQWLTPANLRFEPQCMPATPTRILRKLAGR